MCCHTPTRGCVVRCTASKSITEHCNRHIVNAHVVGSRTSRASCCFVRGFFLLKRRRIIQPQPLQLQKHSHDWGPHAGIRIGMLQDSFASKCNMRKQPRCTSLLNGAGSPEGWGICVGMGHVVKQVWVYGVVRCWVCARARIQSRCYVFALHLYGNRVWAFSA